jgi:hypothetical protein
MSTEVFSVTVLIHVEGDGKTAEIGSSRPLLVHYGWADLNHEVAMIVEDLVEHVKARLVPHE